MREVPLSGRADCTESIIQNRYPPDDLTKVFRNLSQLNGYHRVFTRRSEKAAVLGISRKLWTASWLCCTWQRFSSRSSPEPSRQMHLCCTEFDQRSRNLPEAFPLCGCSFGSRGSRFGRGTRTKICRYESSGQGHLFGHERSADPDKRRFYLTSERCK